MSHHRHKERRVKKSVRFDTDTLILIDKKVKRSGKPFSEVIRRAVNKGLERSVKAKAK